MACEAPSASAAAARRLSVLSRQLQRSDVEDQACSGSDGAVGEVGSVEAWLALSGTQLGKSRWIDITQERVDQFAKVTEDPQWIHEADAAAKGSPFGAPIAHGLLTLSVSSPLAQSVCPTLVGARMGINYGFNKVRFMAPVLVPSRVRVSVSMKEVRKLDKVPPPADMVLHNVMKVVMEIEGSDRPAMIAEWVTRLYL